MAKKNQRIYYVVEGYGIFPYDMLRYDHSWPHSELNDSRKLDNPFATEGAERKRRIMLATDQQGNTPNMDRWKSFTWKVVASGPEAAYVSQWRNDINRASMFGGF